MQIYIQTHVDTCRHISSLQKTQIKQLSHLNVRNIKANKQGKWYHSKNNPYKHDRLNILDKGYTVKILAIHLIK